ncbi:hypothetical protein Acr_20g0003880 [Actinidia rufa]|uniref:CCHC-type domain-containing protein n=1 Tax=Actinidia rufa TaxID=165716 RepID=A0A7J0GCQ5_9ERIC|nr:hypothetical protein Acr_20g0003880 [Actinidia rufa]
MLPDFLKFGRGATIGGNPKGCQGTECDLHDRGHGWISYLPTNTTIGACGYAPSCRLSTGKTASASIHALSHIIKGNTVVLTGVRANLALRIYIHFISLRFWTSNLTVGKSFSKTAPAAVFTIPVLAARAMLINRTTGWCFLCSRRTVTHERWALPFMAAVVEDSEKGLVGVGGLWWDRRVLSLVRFRLRQLVSEPCLYPGLMANTREGSVNEEATGEPITRGDFRQFQQETQQILRDLQQQAIAALLPREPGRRGVAELHQERQERDHRGHDRGPIHPNRPLAYEDESSEDEAYAHEVFGGRRDQGGRGQRDRGLGNQEQGGRVTIRDQVSLHTLYSLNEAVTLAKKVESQQNRTNTRSQFSNKGKQPVPSPQSQPVTNSGSQTKAATTGSTTRQGGNPNPYAKASGDKCYRCGEPGHRSNTCPKRATVNLVEPIPEEEDGGDDGGDVDPYSYDPNEFQDEEEGEYLGRSLNERKVVLGPLKESYIPKVPKEEGKSSVLLVHNEDESLTKKPRNPSRFSRWFLQKEHQKSL